MADHTGEEPTAPPAELPSTLPTLQQAVAARWWSVLFVAGLALLWAGIRLLRTTANGSGFASLLGGLALVTLWAAVRNPLAQNAVRGGTAREDLAFVLLLASSALFLRIFRALEFPYGLLNDTALNACFACAILEGSSFQALPQNLGYVCQYSLLPLFWLVGPNLSAVRWTTAILGTCATLGVYGWVRLLFGSRVAFAAGLLSAVASWEIAFARLAHAPILALGYGAPFLAAMWWTLSRCTWWGPLCAGGLLALAIPTYQAGKWVCLVACLTGLGWGLLQGAPVPRRRLALQGLLVLVVFLTCAFPIVRFAVTDSRTYFKKELDINLFARKNRERPGPSAGERTRTNLERLHKALFTDQPCGGFLGASHRHPVRPHLLLLFVLAGLAVLLGRCGSLLSIYALATFVAALAMGLGSEVALRRLILLAPLFSLFAMIGLVVTGQVLRDILPRPWSSAGTAILFCLVVGSTVVTDVGKFRRETLTDPGLGWDKRFLAEYLRDLAGQYHVYVDPQFGDPWIIDFLLYDRYRHQGERMLSRWYIADRMKQPRDKTPSRCEIAYYLRDGIPIPAQRDRPVLYIIYRRDGEYEETFEAFRRRFADSELPFTPHIAQVPNLERSPQLTFYTLVIPQDRLPQR